MLCTIKIPTLEFTRCFGSFKLSKRELQGEHSWTIDFHLVLSIYQKEKSVYFSTADITYMYCLYILFFNS